jgi:hypothetical protein
MPGARSLIEELADFRSVLSGNDSLQQHLVRAMLLTCSADLKLNSTNWLNGLVKDLVRWMRTGVNDASFLVDICDLLMRLLVRMHIPSTK